MKKVLFCELDGENKLTAITQMFSFKKSKAYPNRALWEFEDDILEDLEQGYDPNEHFSFYVDEHGGVKTKVNY